MTQLGKYTLLKKLATGGMAEVFLARAAGPMGFEKTLVVKRILPHLVDDAAFVQMFLGEAKLAAHLDHPNVVQIFDFGEVDGQYYLAMEFIDGLNLRALARRAYGSGRLLPFGVGARIISFAAEGLAFAHEFCDPATGEPLNLVHRDVSPDNVLVSHTGAVKVVDFGIAKATNQTHHTKTGTLKGKLAYMPPEQLQGKPLDLRADVFALGMVLYELATGAKPFDASTDVSIMQAILFDSMVPASSRRPDVPPTLQAILDRALAKDREERYPSCRHLQADLERFILTTGEPVGPFQLATLVKELTGVATKPVTGEVQHAGSPPFTPPPRVAAAASPPPTASTPAPTVTTQAQTAALTPAPKEPVAQLWHAEFDAAPPTQTSDARVADALTEPMAPRTAAGVPEAEALPPASSKAPWLVAAFAILLLCAGGLWVALRPGPSSASADQTTPAPSAPVAQAEPAKATPAAVRPPPVEATSPAVAAVVPSEPVASPPEQWRKSSSRTGDRRREVTEKSSSAKERAPVVVAARATEPAKKAASFRLESSPSAQARVNGKFVGLTPVNVTGLEPGRVEVEVYDSRLGFRKKEQVQLAAGDNGTRKIMVAPAKLEFRVRPYATVILNDKTLGQTPFAAVDVYEGVYKVRLVNRDLNKDVTVKFDVKPGGNVFKYNLSAE